MGFSEDFINECREEGIDRRVWLVVGNQVFIAPDPIANHEDLLSLLAEQGVSLVGFNWKTAPQGDIMNAVARGSEGFEGWVGAVQAEFDLMLEKGLHFELLGPDERASVLEPRGASW